MLIYLQISLEIAGAVFHTKMLKATWVSTNHITENKVDQLCESRKFRRTLLDIREQMLAQT